MSRHLLVTNDFPPKVGGIQSYLWELWRRLDPATFTVLTATSHPDAAAFDAEQRRRGVDIRRRRGRLVYLPTPALARLVRRTAHEVGADAVVLDPVLPLGLLGPRLGLPYAVVLHGAEVTVPGRLPGSRAALAAVVGGADLVVSAGGYPAAEARRAARGRLGEVVEVPPGVDTSQIVPLEAAARPAARARLGIDGEALVVSSVSRLVPRKGMDVLIEAAARLAPSFPALVVAIAGTGRDAARLDRLAARRRAPVRLLGRVDEAAKADLLGSSDVFAMACRTRWAGLEQEGFGIVFLEAAAAGVPQVAGRSGGADEAVADGATGLVVDHPGDPGAVATALRRLLADPALRRRLGDEARRRAVASFDEDVLAPRLAAALGRLGRRGPRSTAGPRSGAAPDGTGE